MPISVPVFRVFVSSTFGDLKAERRALHKRVFEPLRAMCASRDAEFQAIDLRWGVSAEAVADQRAVEICLREVARCRQVTRRPNFLLLLGDRYGARPLPSAIEGDSFRRVHVRLSEDDARIVDRWYLEDRNAVPSVFVLQPRRGPYQASDVWDEEERRVRSALLRAAAERPAEEAVLRLLRTSITEQESVRGIPEDAVLPGAAFVFWRRIDGIPEDAAAGPYRDLVDGEPDQDALDSLWIFRRGLRRRLGDEAISEYQAAWDMESGRPTTSHIDRMCQDAYAKLAGVILDELDRAAAPTAARHQEDRYHQEFGDERRGNFTGRQHEIDTILGHLASGARRPLLVIGEPGIGKTALLAEIANRLSTQVGAGRVIVRFIGATPRSADTRTLLDDLRRAMRGGTVSEAEAPMGLAATAEAFHDALAAVSSETGVILVLDALDQLVGPPDLSWLPAEMPPGVRVLLSAQDGSDMATAAVDVGAITLRLSALTPDKGDELLRRWLSESGRTLTENQRTEVLRSFAVHGNPLHLRLAFGEAHRWASYTPVQPGALATDVGGILRQLLDRLEDDHGAALVRRALGLIAVSRHGLSEGEMLDLLSGDAAVLGEVERRMPFSPSTGGQLPPVLWALLNADLEPYLNERRSEGRMLLGFYHRQLTAAVAARYLAGTDAAEAHCRLADYFGAQPLDLDGQEHQAANTRKLTELPYQQAHGACWDELWSTLTDFSFLQRKIEAVGVEEAIDQQGHPIVTHTGVYALQADFDLALQLWPDQE
jgi:hypothetical protein